MIGQFYLLKYSGPTREYGQNHEGMLGQCINTSVTQAEESIPENVLTVYESITNIYPLKYEHTH